MADDNEEDLFADLYDNDEPIAPKQEPAPAAAPAPALSEIATDPSAIAPDTLQNGSQSIPAAVGDGHTQNPDSQVAPWQGNENSGDVGMSMGEDAPAPEEHRPIGIKEDGKMFVGGLNWETTDDSLKDYFTQFGEVAECTVMRDAATGRSRGFGFLTFKDPKDVNLVMVKEHYLDGKIIDPKRAIPRDEQERTAKIFVGGVSQEATEEDFKNYFSQYGRVIDATLMMDKDTGRPRGFGFVTFDSEQAVDNTLRGDLHILGKAIEVKKAQPRGNIKEEENFGVRGGRNRRGQDSFDQGNGQGGMGGGAGGAPMQQAGMTPQMMALWWQQMQRMMGMYAAGGMMPGAGAGGNMSQGQMNPQMMQQMYMQMQQKQNGAGGNNSPMPNAPAGPSGGNRQGTPGNMIAQQKYGGGQWDGMYDDGNGMGQDGGHMGGGGAFAGRGRGRGGFRGRGGGGAHFDKQPPSGPSNAPVNAPTGPKNAGQPGANYRGGRGGGGRGGFHPYRR